MRSKNPKWFFGENLKRRPRIKMVRKPEIVVQIHTMVEQAKIDAFLQRMAARKKREEAEAVPEETPGDLQNAYLKRTGREAMTSTGSGKGPRPEN